MDTILDLNGHLLSEDARPKFALKNTNFLQQLDSWDRKNAGHSITVKIYEDKGYLTVRAEGVNETHLMQVNAIIEEYFYPYLLRDGDDALLG